MFFKGYSAEIVILSPYSDAVTAFLLDRNMNLSVFTLIHIFSREIGAFRRRGQCFCWCSRCRAPGRADAGPKTAVVSAINRWRVNMNCCGPYESVTPTGSHQRKLPFK